MSHRSFASLLVFAVAGCVGGQSGTEGPSTAPSCVCSAVNGTPIRATVMASAGDHYDLRIDEILVPATEAPAELVSRTSVGGTWIPTCENLTIGTGASVLAFYRQGGQSSTQCVEYNDCSTARCGPQPGETATLDDFATWDECDTTCLEETRTACALHEEESWMNGGLGLARWDAGIWEFGTQGGPVLTLPDSELGTLLDDVACQMEFPPPRIDDTPGGGTDPTEIPAEPPPGG